MAKRQQMEIRPEERLQRAACLLAMGAIRAARQKHVSRTGEGAAKDAGMKSRALAAQPSRHESEVQEQPAPGTG